MNELFDHILGFMPHRAVFWAALATSLTVILFQIGAKKLEEIVKLPYMEEENKKARQDILGETEKSQQSKS